MRFAVWAPRSRTVELVLRGDRLAMEPDADGWWAGEAEADPGDRYGFSLDGGPARPDPRSRAQPDGAEGLSAVYDHDAHVWSDDAWAGIRWPGAVLYELHVGTFSAEGTFAGAIEHLPHLVDLGVDAVELLPVATFSGDRGWGYDGVHLFAPHPAYGGPDGLKALVDACHAHGLGVLIDVVYNHFGPVGNHLPEYGPYLTDRHTTAWGDAVAVDGRGSQEVRRFLLDNARSWIRDFHADGLRLDAVHAIVDGSEPHLLTELARVVHDEASAAGRAAVVIAESESNDPALLRSEPAGHGLDGVWSDDWHHALHTLLTGERDGYYGDFGAPEDLVKALEQAWVYDGRWSEHQGAVRGGPVTGLPRGGFVVSTQTHDQVGNRAGGERLAHLVSPGRARVAAALLCTTPFTPMLFQGEEWGATAPFLYFTDHRDPELGRAVRDGRRAEFAAFGWDPEEVPDPQDPATFGRSMLDWDERAAGDHASLLRWHRELLALRRLERDLHDPLVPARATWDDGLLTVARGSFVVIANLAAEPRTSDEPGAVVLASDDVAEGPGWRLPVDSVAILQREPTTAIRA